MLCCSVLCCSLHVRVYGDNEQDSTVLPRMRRVDRGVAPQVRCKDRDVTRNVLYTTAQSLTTVYNTVAAATARPSFQCWTKAAKTTGVSHPFCTQVILQEYH